MDRSNTNLLQSSKQILSKVYRLAKLFGVDVSSHHERLSGFSVKKKDPGVLSSNLENVFELRNNKARDEKPRGHRLRYINDVMSCVSSIGSIGSGNPSVTITGNCGRSSS